MNFSKLAMFLSRQSRQACDEDKASWGEERKMDELWLCLVQHSCVLDRKKEGRKWGRKACHLLPKAVLSFKEIESKDKKSQAYRVMPWGCEGLWRVRFSFTEPKALIPSESQPQNYKQYAESLKANWSALVLPASKLFQKESLLLIRSPWGAILNFGHVWH